MGPTDVAPSEDEVDAAMTAYAAALAALTAASVAETAALWDRLVPGLVEEIPDALREVLVGLLARSWAASIVRARSLAHVTAYRLTGIVPEPMVDPDLPRLLAAAETLLTRCEDMTVGADDADPRRPRDGSVEEALNDNASLRLRDALDRAAVEEADRLDRLADEAADRAAAEADLLAERRERIDAAREDLRRDREAARADREATREADMDDARRRRQEREDRVRARVEARAERRAAQRARAERIARAEATAAAAEAFPAAVERSSRFVGWIRKLDTNPCDRCLAWWSSGGVARGPTPVRPFTVRMKRHNGCECVQQPVTEEEADARGITTEPEPVHRTQRSRDAARRRHRRPAGDAAG